MRINKPKSLIVFAIIALAMSGCGKSNSSAVPPGAIVNGQYAGGTAGGALGSACTPLTSPISFQGAMYIDSANVIAGQGMPQSGGAGYGTNYGGAIQMTSLQYAPYNTDAVMTIQAQMISQTMANAGGTLQLSQLKIQQIMMQTGGGVYGTPGYGQVPCGQIVAINVGHYNTTLYGGTVTILINGTMPAQIMF